MRGARCTTHLPLLYIPPCDFPSDFMFNSFFSILNPPVHLDFPSDFMFKSFFPIPTHLSLLTVPGLRNKSCLTSFRGHRSCCRLRAHLGENTLQTFLFLNFYVVGHRLISPVSLIRTPLKRNQLLNWNFRTILNKS